MLSILSIVAALSPEIAAKCRYLEGLNRQYANVKMSPQEERVKWQLINWYQANCKKRG